jgi:hypothetical protein
MPLLRFETSRSTEETELIPILKRVYFIFMKESAIRAKGRQSARLSYNLLFESIIFATAVTYVSEDKTIRTPRGVVDSVHA